MLRPRTELGRLSPGSHFAVHQANALPGRTCAAFFLFFVSVHPAHDGTGSALVLGGVHSFSRDAESAERSARAPRSAPQTPRRG